MLYRSSSSLGESRKKSPSKKKGHKKKSSIHRSGAKKPRLKPNVIVLGDQELSKKVREKLKSYHIDVRTRTTGARTMESIDRQTLAVIATSPLTSDYIQHFVRTFKTSPVGNLPLYIILFRDLPTRNIGLFYEQGVEAVFYWQTEKEVMLELITRNLKLNLKSQSKKEIDADNRLETFLRCKFQAHGFSKIPSFFVENSSVVLKGTFTTLQQRRRIVEFFEQAPGVQSVDTSESQIKKYPITDQTLKKRINLYLENIDELDSEKIKILAVDGIVSLIGEVSNPDIIQQAQITVEQIKGVREIHNFLEAQTPKKQKHGKRLANKLAAQIHDSFPDVQDIEIVFNADVATISGKVSLLSNKNYIERFVLNNSHAAKVINKLQVDR